MRPQLLTNWSHSYWLGRCEWKGRVSARQHGRSMHQQHEQRQAAEQCASGFACTTLLSYKMHKERAGACGSARRAAHLPLQQGGSGFTHTRILELERHAQGRSSRVWQCQTHGP